MRKNPIIYNLIILVTILTSCKKELPASQYGYIGYWGDNIENIVIEQDGSGEYHYDNSYFSGNGSTKTVDIVGRVKIEDGIITIKSGLKKKFTITQEPTIDDAGATYMILDESFIFYKKE